MNYFYGPCLLHCYYTNSIILILIGFLVGLLVSFYYLRNHSQFRRFLTFDKNANNLFD